MQLRQGIVVSVTTLMLGAACSRPDDRAANRAGSAVVIDSPSAAVSSPAPPSPAYSPTNDSLLISFERVVLALGHSRDSLARSLGTPTSTIIREGENAEGGRDSLITVRYDHIEFFLRKPLADGREYFSNVVVTDSGFALPGGITPDRTTLGELSTVVGAPHRILQFADSSVYTYDIPRGPVLQFFIVDQILRKVRWVYELG